MQQLFNAALKDRINHVSLNHEVLVDEFGRVGVVGMNAAYLGGGQVDLVRLFSLEEGAHGGLVGQVQLGMGAGEDAFGGVASGQQLANDGRAVHAAVACHVDAGWDVCHLHASIGCTATRP